MVNPPKLLLRRKIYIYRLYKMERWENLQVKIKVIIRWHMIFMTNNMVKDNQVRMIHVVIHNMGKEVHLSQCSNQEDTIFTVIRRATEIQRLSSTTNNNSLKSFNKRNLASLVIFKELRNRYLLVIIWINLKISLIK